MNRIMINDKGQAVAPKTVEFGKEAFERNDQTEIRWLGNGGAMINSQGTVLMIDPLLKGFDMPLLMDRMPILPEEVPFLDGVLITHIDNDHYSRPTCQDIKDVCRSFHSTRYVAQVMNEEGLKAEGHDIGDHFEINDVSIYLSPARHNWQNGSSKYAYRQWLEEDYCGYWIETVDGSIWMPGDSKLMDEQLHMPQPDVILFDFADNDWHITLEGAIRLANTYPEAELICIHWGCVDAPTMTPFNGNPKNLYEKTVNPERIRVLSPGEVFVMKGKQK